MRAPYATAARLLSEISWKRTQVQKHFVEFSFFSFLCLFHLSLAASKHFKRGPPDDSQASLDSADVPTRVDCERLDACSVLPASNDRDKE